MQTLAIGVFVKLPVPGRVKTRLARTVGPERAARLYAKMVELLFERALIPLDKKKFTVYLLYDSLAPLGEYKKLWGQTGFSFLPQSDGDLGRRLDTAHRALLEKHPAVALIGSDCIELAPTTFEACASSLAEGADVVLGPAIDGGYYLVAMAKTYPALFQQVKWSTDSVFETSVEKARKAKLSVKLLPTLGDIDEDDDLAQYPELNSVK